LFKQNWIEFDDIVLNISATFGSVSGLQTAVLKNFSATEFHKSVGIVHCVCLNVETCLRPVKQVCTFMYHVIKVMGLV